MKRHFIKSVITIFAMTLTIVSCGKDDDKPTPPPNKEGVESISIDPQSLEVGIGSEENLAVEITPKEAESTAVSWKSLNPAVATVSDEGVVKGIATGTTEITATAAGKTATCTVKVLYVSVQSLTLSETKVSLAAGKTLSLTVKIAPLYASSKKVSWASADPAVATISDKGLVTAVAAGTTTITATAGGKSAIVGVTVSRPNSSYQISFVSSHPKGYEKIKISVDAAAADRPDVWIDLNNNGVREAGEEVKGWGDNPYDRPLYVLNNDEGRVTIYGKVTLLLCDFNYIKTLDLSKNNQLEVLDCSSNRELTALEVSNQTKLKKLTANGVRITTLDVSQNTALEYLNVSATRLSSIDVSKNTQLKDLLIIDNEDLLSKEGYAKIINSLPNRKGQNGGTFRPSDNYGAFEDDFAAALTDKNWIIDYNPEF